LSNFPQVCATNAGACQSNLQASVEHKHINFHYYNYINVNFNDNNYIFYIYFINHHDANHNQHAVIRTKLDTDAKSSADCTSDCCDIIILIDSSESIGNDNFNSIKTFLVNNLLDDLSISVTQTEVAFVVFNNVLVTEESRYLVADSLDGTKAFVNGWSWYVGTTNYTDEFV